MTTARAKGVRELSAVFPAGFDMKLPFRVTTGIVSLLLAAFVVPGMLLLSRELIANGWSSAFTAFLIPAAVLQSLVVLLFIGQWMLIIRWMGFPVSFRTMAGVYCAATIVECLTPSVKAGGEVTKVLLLKNRAGLDHARGTAAVLVQKSLSALVFLVLAGLSLLGLMTFGDGLPPSWTPQLAIASIGVLLAGFALLALRKWTPTDQIPYQPGLRSAAFRLFAKVANALASFRAQPHRIGIHVGMSVMIWGLFPVTLGVLLHGLDAEMPWYLLGAITFTSYIAGMLPILPGGVGSFDAVMVILLRQSGMDLAAAVALTLAFRVVSFWFVLACCSAFAVGEWLYRTFHHWIVSRVPNMITFGNLLLGMTSVMLCLSGVDRRIAAACILGAALLDALDGWFARRLNAESAFGKELDSLSDLVSFGVAPMAVLFTPGSFAHGFFVPISLAFIAASAFRLARYNVSAPARGFTGLPITAAGITVALLVLFFPARASWVDQVVVVSLAAAMVSVVPIPRLRLVSDGANQPAPSLGDFTPERRSHARVYVASVHLRRPAAAACDRAAAQSGHRTVPTL